MISTILSWLTGSAIGAISKPLLQAYQARLNAQNDADKLAADLQIRQIEAELETARNAKEIRMATAGFWEMRLVTFVIAACFTLHLVLVTLDTCFALGWRIAAYPAPFDQWEGSILLSFFGIYFGGKTVSSAIAAITLRRR